MALPVADAWVPPPAIDEFAILRPLGRGGMGHVYLARDTLLERLVAIKLMHRYSDAIARERFVVEARAAARIQHPNVVAVYRIGEIGGHPFIVSEYLDGASLADVPVPMPWRDALEVGRGLARGLAAAHAHGVLHRDIKPANAIRSAAGAVKLLDFGLAKLPVEAGAPGDEPRPHPGEAADARRARALASTLDPLGASPDPTLAPTLDPPGLDDAFAEPVPLRRGGSPAPLTRHGAVMGTPGYMPPEAWRGDPATPRSDVYSLGALLLFLCTGREPHARVPLAQLAAVTAEQDVPGVATLAAGIDPAFAAVIDRCLARDPAARFASAAAVLDALESIGARPAAVPEGNPYRGLLPFDGAHRSLFFGRGADVRAVTERLRAAPFVLVAGQSGVGKSSLCRAGVLPLFVEGGLGDERRWSALVTSPGRAPTMALRAALSAAGLPLADPLEPGSLVGALGAERGLVLFVDQLEELLTLGEPAQVEGFCVFLAELVRAAPPNVRVLATARGDHFTRLAELPALGPAVERAFHLLRPMDRPAIREAIEGPARTLGAAFESEAMVEALVDAGAAGGLPPLQFALANLWEARDGGQLTSAALARIGGVEGALARHADEVASGMAGPVRAAARRVLLRLVTAERTRAHRSAAELATDDAARAAIEVLVRGRLVIARDEPGGEAEYTIAHEALVTRWDTLRRWIEESGETRHARERVAAAAAEWEKLERSPDALLRGRRLQEARGLEASELSSPERALVQASVRAARLGLGLRGAALAAIPALIAAVYFAQASLHRREVARRVAQELAAGEEGLARAAASEAVIAGARRRAFEAFDLGNTERAEGAWAEALAGAAEQEAILAGAAVAIERALALDPRREQSRREMAGVLHALALAAERDHRGKRARDLRQRVAIYDDGTLAAGDDEPATLTLAVSPPGTKGTIAAYTADASGRRSLGPPRPLAAGGERLAPGSYLVGLSAPGFAEVRYPVELGRGERLAARVDMLPESQVPDGFVHVPEGRFWFGSAEVEEIRKWQSAAPAHHRRTPPFLVARREATHAEWIAFLQAQPPERREAFLPKVTAGFWGTMALAPAPGGWELTLQPTQHAYVVRTGERLRYRDRVRNAEVDWAELPVSGVSWAQARVYLSWLSGTGAVPGARPCREDEWERAARGADLRVYPHGDALLPEDANFDETYHRKALAFGPDEAGAHPASQSPFGLDDMVGNVFELTASARSPGEVVIRGGSYYVDRPTSQLTNRNVFQPDDRIPTVGFRVCADVPR